MIRSTQRIQSEVELKNYKQWLIFFSELDSLWRMSIKNINLVSSINIYEIVVFRLNDFLVCAWLSLPTLESQLISSKKSESLNFYLHYYKLMIKITDKWNNLNFMAYMPDWSIRECLKVCWRFYLAQINEHFKLTVDDKQLKKEDFILVE